MFRSLIHPSFFMYAHTASCKVELTYMHWFTSQRDARDFRFRFIKSGCKMGSIRLHVESDSLLSGRWVSVGINMFARQNIIIIFGYVYTGSPILIFCPIIGKIPISGNRSVLGCLCHMLGEILAISNWQKQAYINNNDKEIALLEAA